MKIRKRHQRKRKKLSEKWWAIHFPLRFGAFSGEEALSFLDPKAHKYFIDKVKRESFLRVKRDIRLFS